MPTIRKTVAWSDVFRGAMRFMVSNPSSSPEPWTPPPLNRPFDGGTDAFFLSPTWTWPVFDPECCQECGRVIPMHETGWILRELILCEDCFQILDDLATQRAALIEHHQQPEALHPSPPSVATPGLNVETTPAPTPFELTPGFESRPRFAALALDDPTPAEVSPDDGSCPLFDSLESCPPIADSPVPELESPATEPAFELTPCFEPRPTFAPPALTISPPSEVIATDGDTFPLFDYFEAVAAECPMDWDSMSAIEPAEPVFQLTAPPRYEPRTCFAPPALLSMVPARVADDGTPGLFDTVDTPAPEPVVEPPIDEPERVLETPPAPSQPEPVGVPPAVTAESLPPLPVSAEPPQHSTTVPSASSTAPAIAPELAAPIAPAAPAPIGGFDSEQGSPAAAPQQPPVIEATPLPAVPMSPPPPAAAPSPVQTPLSPALPSFKAKARKPRLAPRQEPPPPPLNLVHPVDVLLNKLHHEQVDAQVWNTLNRWRSLDPLHGEMDAMLAVAVELRDRWLARRDAADRRRSSAG
jgi:hypothetical protein